MIHVCENVTLHSCKHNIILFNKKNNISTTHKSSYNIILINYIYPLLL